MSVENLCKAVIVSMLVLIAVAGVAVAGPGVSQADDPGLATIGSETSGALSDDSTEAEPNDNRSEATPIPNSGTLRGEVNNTAGNNDTDWFSFDADAGDGVHFFTGDMIESVSGTVYAPNGSAVFSFETGGMDSYVKGTILQQTGTYYVAFTSGANNISPSYWVGFETTSPDPFEPNENSENAVSIPTNGTITRLDDGIGSVKAATTNATVFENGDEDWFAVDATAGENITAVARPWRTTDYGQYVSIDIFDSNGEPIGVIEPSDIPQDLSNRTYDFGSARGSPSEATQAATAEDAGTYYIRVRSPNDRVAGYVEYLLAVDSTATGNETRDGTKTRVGETTEDTELPNTLTIQSTDTQRVLYNVSASGRMEPGASADLAESGAVSPDSVSGTTATGSTAERGKDSFTFAGEITEVALRGGSANVLINGERVDPDSFASGTPTTTATSTTTTTSTPTTTSTTTASSTPTMTTSAVSRTNTETEQTELTRESGSTSETDTTSASTTTDSASQTTQSESDGTILGGTTAGSAGSRSGEPGPGFGIIPAVGAIVVLGTLIVFRRR